MKKQFIIISISLFCCLQVGHAQQRISLIDAVEYAAKNRYDAQANKLDIDLAKNVINKSRNEWIPELKANGEMLYNSQLQSMIFGDGKASKMGTKNLTTLSLDFSQAIFKPELRVDIKINKAALSVKDEVLREKENDIKQSVKGAYLNVIFREQQLELSRESTERYKSYFELAQNKMELGIILESELLQAQTDYENAKINLRKTKQNYILAMKTLKYHLNISDLEEVILTDSLSTLVNNTPLQTGDVAIDNRPELKQIYYSQQENDLQLKKSCRMLLPSLSLMANYTTQYQSDNFRFSQRYWYPYNYIGLKASLSLSNIFKSRTDRREYQIKSTQLAMQYKQKLHDLNYEREKSSTELLNAFGNINSTTKTLSLSKKLYSQQLVIYKLGTITYSALLDAESSINTAEENYITAVYEYLIAYANYTRAIGICF